MPHIVHLVRRTSGGMQTHLLDLVSGLSARGYRLSVISPPNQVLKEQLCLTDVPHYEIDISDRMSPKDFLAVTRLARCFKTLRPDVLHIHGNKTALVGVPAAALANVNAIVLTVHNYLRYEEATSPLSAAAGLVERRLAKRISKIIAVSHSIKDGLVESQRIDPSKVTVIHNGIDLRKWDGIRAPDRHARAELGLSSDDFAIVAVGRLVEFKGHEILIEATALAASRPRLRVLIAGDGPLLSELKESIDRRGLQENVRLLGRVPDVGKLMAASDLFVFPSLKEPFGLVLLEAQAVGLPIIACDAGGASEIIEDGVTGMLVAPGDATALAAAIDDLVEDASKRRDLALAGQAAVATRFSLNRFIVQVEEVYGSLAKSARRKSDSAKIGI